MGLKLKKLSDFTARFDKAGLKYDPPRIGREEKPQTYVNGPDTFPDGARRRPARCRRRLSAITCTTGWSTRRT
jgi:hypothetical protein